MTMSLGEFDRNCEDKFGQVAEKQTVEVDQERQGIITSNGERFSNLGLRFLCHMICFRGNTNLLALKVLHNLYMVIFH